MMIVTYLNCILPITALLMVARPRNRGVAQVRRKGREVGEE